MRYMKEVRKLQQARGVKPEDLITLKEAKEILGISYHAIGDLVSRGVLTRYIDTEEPNPMRATRVHKQEINEEMDRRNPESRKRKPPTDKPTPEG